MDSVEQAIAALEQQRTAIGDAVVDLALAPLVERRNRLRAGTAGEQRKLVTVLFADLVDFTVLSQALDPEDVRAIVAEYFAVWARCIEDEGGVVEKFIGDAVMAVFGIHRSREDDPHRAVRAALAMTDRLGSLNARLESGHRLNLRMRVGIDTGEVVVSTLGDHPGNDFVVVGENVNRAARLQAAAPPGGILISADTCLHVKGSFALQRIESLQLKGIAEPIEAYLALAAGPTEFWPETRGIEGVTTRMVGRDLELGWLHKMFDEVAVPDAGISRRLTVGTVVGHAGVGKSRLVREFETWLAGLPDPVWLLRARATPATQDVPNGLLRNLLADRMQISPGDGPEMVRAKLEQGVESVLDAGPNSVRAAHTLAGWLGFEIGSSPHLAALSSNPQGVRGQAMAHLGEYLRRLTERAPVVIVLEDVHWADDASLDWLTDVGEVLGDFPLMVVATARPVLLERRPHWGEGLDFHAPLRLSPLSARDTRRLVGEVLQRAPVVPDSVADLVVSTAEGNPFYVEELVKWLVAEGVIDTAGDRWTVSDRTLDMARVPATLKGLIQARLDTLPPRERSAAQRGSVLGRVFWDEAVRRLDPTVENGADPFPGLRAAEIVFQREHSAFDGTREFSFRHSLLRDVAYESMLKASRRTYHGLAAEWMEEVTAGTGRADEYAAAIAGHLEAAERGEEAARWYLRAGERAAGAYANAEAIDLFRRAERLAPAGSNLVVEILLAIEAVLDRVGDRSEQRTVLDRLGELALEPCHRAAVQFAEARWAFFHGEYASAVADAGEAATLAATAGLATLEAEAHIVAAKSLIWKGSFDEADPVLMLAQQRAAEVGDPRIAAKTRRFQSVISLYRGDLPGALDLVEQGLAELSRRPDAFEESLLGSQKGVVLDGMGRYDEALASYQGALASTRAQGYRFGEGMLVGNMAGVALAQGRLGDARAGADESLAICEDIGDVEGQAEPFYTLGEVARLSGDHATARRRFAAAVDLADQVDADWIVVNAVAAEALIAATEGDGDGAIAGARQAIDRAARSGMAASEAHALLVAGLVELDGGDAEQAAVLLGQARTGWAKLGVEQRLRESEAALALAEHRIGRSTEAHARLDLLLDRLEPADLEGCAEPGRVLLACAELAAAAGDDGSVRVVADAIARYLSDRAVSIDDDDLRSGFLEINPVNVALAERAGRVTSRAGGSAA
jgi:class 3 adenylate cyclase/tetratricopeptide (TPR) repeat protein